MSLDFVGGDVGLFDVGFLDGDNVGSNVGDCVGLLDGNIDSLFVVQIIFGAKIS